MGPSAECALLVFSFEASIIQSLGYTGNHAQLMSVPPFAVAFCCEHILVHNAPY